MTSMEFIAADVEAAFVARACDDEARGLGVRISNSGGRKRARLPRELRRCSIPDPMVETSGPCAPSPLVRTLRPFVILVAICNSSLLVTLSFLPSSPSQSIEKTNACDFLQAFSCMSLTY